jgi:FkbM family methyltransferase
VNLHKVLPRALRQRLLRTALVRGAMRRWLAGPVTRPYLAGGFVFSCDGYRNFGFARSDLRGVEAREREFARRYLGSIRATSIWDIGANVGFWTLWLAASVDRTCRIRAFEPDARNLVHLRENVGRNRLANVELRDCALSSASGTMILELDETAMMNSLRSSGLQAVAARAGAVPVAVRTVDEEVAEFGAPDFVKIDVEGHELDVLKGASALLAARRSVLLLEVTRPASRSGQDAIDLLRAAGYTVQALDGREIERPDYYVVASPTKLDRDLFPA